MSVDRDKTIAILNDLIETCRDGQEGFRDAAEHVKDPQLKQMFMEVATERARFAGELQNEIERLGEPNPETSGSVSGSLHRGWIHLKEVFAKNDDRAIVNECERGEDTAVESYRKALERRLPRDIRDIVERQCERVKMAHDRVSELKHSLSHA